MPIERWIIYRKSKVRSSITFYTGKFVSKLPPWIKHQPGGGYAQWTSKLENGKVIIFKSYDDAKKEMKSLYIGNRNYDVAIDMYPGDRYV